jgi:hypothetical protein
LRIRLLIHTFVLTLYFLQKSNILPGNPWNHKSAGRRFLQRLLLSSFQSCNTLNCFKKFTRKSGWGFEDLYKSTVKTTTRVPFPKVQTELKRAYLKHAQLRDKCNSLLLNSVETLDLLSFSMGGWDTLLLKINSRDNTMRLHTLLPLAPKSDFGGINLWHLCGSVVWREFDQH